MNGMRRKKKLIVFELWTYDNASTTTDFALTTTSLQLSKSSGRLSSIDLVNIMICCSSSSARWWVIFFLGKSLTESSWCSSLLTLLLAGSGLMNSNIALSSKFVLWLLTSDFHIIMVSQFQVSPHLNTCQQKNNFITEELIGLCTSDAIIRFWILDTYILESNSKLIFQTRRFSLIISWNECIRSLVHGRKVLRYWGERGSHKLGNPVDSYSYHVLFLRCIHLDIGGDCAKIWWGEMEKGKNKH